MGARARVTTTVASSEASAPQTQDEPLLRFEFEGAPAPRTARADTAPTRASAIKQAIIAWLEQQL